MVWTRFFISTSRNMSIVFSSGVRKSGRCATGERGMRFTFAIGTRRTCRASSSAQARESLTPLMTVYSKVMMRFVAFV